MSHFRPHRRPGRRLVAALVAALVLLPWSPAGPTQPAALAASSQCDVNNCATFRVILRGAGAGTYQTADGGIDCQLGGGVQTGRCSHEYAWSRAAGPTLQVIATVTPSTRSVACSATTMTCDQSPQGLTIVLTAGQAASDTVEFQHLPVTVWASASGTGAGAVTMNPGGVSCRATCPDTLPYGSVVTIAATPDAGSAFSGWTGACAGQGETCQLTLVTEMTTGAVFVPSSALAPAPGVTVPRVSLVGPASTSTGSLLVKVDWAGIPATSPIVAYDLQVRSGAGGWTRVRPDTGSTSATVSLPVGVASQLRVRAGDAIPRTGDWTTGPLRTPLAYQEGSSAVAYRGSWASRAATGAWGGRVRASKTAGSTTTLTFTGLAVAVIAPRGPAQGSARIAIDGVTVRTVSLYSRTAAVRQVVFLKVFPTSGRHTLKVTVVGTRGHPEVAIDGFAVLR